MTDAEACAQLPPLLYADWLDDQNRPEDAEIVRLRVELERPAPVPPKRPSALGIVARIAFPFGGGVFAVRRIDRYKAELAAWAKASRRREWAEMRHVELCRQQITRMLTTPYEEAIAEAHDAV